VPGWNPAPGCGGQQVPARISKAQRRKVITDAVSALAAT
jgi:hypothetical protein